MKSIYAFAFVLVLMTQCCQIKHVSALGSHLAKLYGCQNNFILRCQIVDVFHAKYTSCVFLCMLCTSSLKWVDAFFFPDLKLNSWR